MDYADARVFDAGGASMNGMTHNVSAGRYKTRVVQELSVIFGGSFDDVLL